MIDSRLFMVQRVTALIMAPLVLGHLAMMIIAVQGGLSASEILSRTQGSWFWMLYYGLFVVAVSIHAAIGIRTILFEWCHITGWILRLISWGIALFLLLLGFQSVSAVTRVFG